MKKEDKNKGKNRGKVLEKNDKDNLKNNGKFKDKLGDGLVRKIAKPFQKETSPIEKRKLTIGERTADGLTKWAGSWTFILIFLFFMFFWMTLNTYFWFKMQTLEPFDPYPFILLNLVLSCLAAIQAPIILMSQNRQSQMDRQRLEYDYYVNRKSEREIRVMKKQLDRIERKLYENL